MALFGKKKARKNAEKFLREGLEWLEEARREGNREHAISAALAAIRRSEAASAAAATADDDALWSRANRLYKAAASELRGTCGVRRTNPSKRPKKNPAGRLARLTRI
jgi:hypothetical protein